VPGEEEAIPVVQVLPGRASAGAILRRATAPGAGHLAIRGRSRCEELGAASTLFQPRREGAKRLRAVKAAHPETPLIAISGQFRPGLAGSCAAADALGVGQVIAKPFSRHDLLAAVHSVIGPAR